MINDTSPKQTETILQLREKTLLLERALEMEQIISGCIRKLYLSTDSQNAIQYVLNEISSFFHASRAFMYELQEQRFVNCVGKHLDTTKSQNEFYMVLDISFIKPWREAFENQKSIIVKNIADLKADYPDTYELLNKINVSNLAITPIFHKNILSGFIGISNADFAMIENVSMLDILGSFLNVFIERMHMNQMLVEKSFVDSLTGLYNRNRFIEDSSLYSQSEQPLGIIYADVNGLKQTNDLYGHQYGDKILKQCASNLKQIFSDATIYRLGGDEFVIIQQNITKDELEQKIKSLKALLQSTSSQHIALGWTHSRDGKQFQECITLADEKMYYDKTQYYRQNPTITRYRHQNEVGNRLSQKEELLKSIAENRFQVYLQAKVDLSKKTLIGAEALVRFINSDNHILLPDQFIPFMEEARTIRLLDFYVFETVCRLIEKWKFTSWHDIPISVNFSRYTIVQPDFIQKINSIWSKYRFDKNMIEIEIAEKINDIDNINLLQLIQAIKAAGFLASIDDFGLQYSNLTLFTSTDVDVLKLDKSLIRDINHNYKSQLLVKSLVQICHNLDMRLIVEGVENKEQFDILSALKCDGAQGYLISKPVAISEFEKMFS